jgi:hypothetical protein
VYVVLSLTLPPLGLLEPAVIEPVHQLEKRMPTKPLDVVRKSLQVYADRGVFRGLNEVKPRHGKESFTFVWLGDRPLELGIDTEAALLKFKHLLPNVPSNSELYSELKRFLTSRSAEDLPRHRRIDSKRAEVVWMNRSGNVSIALRVRNNQYAYGLNRLINLVHDLFVKLNDSHPEYMCETFDVPQE